MEAFHIDVVLVMGHDKLYSKFSSDVAEHVTVVKLPKSGGVVDRVSNLDTYKLNYFIYAKPSKARN
jgi:polyribonucleotide 5'-hydroxyl-kinase